MTVNNAAVLWHMCTKKIDFGLVLAGLIAITFSPELQVTGLNSRLKKKKKVSFGRAVSLSFFWHSFQGFFFYAAACSLTLGGDRIFQHYLFGSSKLSTCVYNNSSWLRILNAVVYFGFTSPPQISASTLLPDASQPLSAGSLPSMPFVCAGRSSGFRYRVI